MESADLHSQHELQEQFGLYSSVLPTQSSHKVSNTHNWNPSTLLNIGAERMPNLKELWPNWDTTFMNQNHGISDGRNLFFSQQSANEQLFLAKIKHEMANSFPYVPRIYKEEDLYSEAHNPPSDGFSHAFPNTDISSSLVSSSLGLNLQTFDLLTSANYGGSSIQSSLSLGHDFMQELQESSSNNSIKVAKSGVRNGFTRAKRGSNTSKAKEVDAEPKKSRVVSRSSCPPLKVRKEKLGDRIAALQKLVAPFGKTDTASVLTEAIGYIQFLEDQVQTLSVPYMKSSHAESRGTIQAGSSEDEENGDLRSRGLCLAPLSSASYMDTCGGGMWPIP